MQSVAAAFVVAGAWVAVVRLHLAADDRPDIEVEKMLRCPRGRVYLEAGLSGEAQVAWNWALVGVNLPMSQSVVVYLAARRPQQFQRPCSCSRLMGRRQWKQGDVLDRWRVRCCVRSLQDRGGCQSHSLPLQKYSKLVVCQVVE